MVAGNALFFQTFKLVHTVDVGVILFRSIFVLEHMYFGGDSCDLGTEASGRRLEIS